MFRNMNSNILFDVSSNFSSSFFGDKTAKSTDINIFALGKSIFYFFKHGFECYQNINLWDTCFFRYLINEVCFSHCYEF